MTPTATGARHLASKFDQFNWITGMSGIEAAIRSACARGTHEVFVHARTKLVSVKRLSELEQELWQLGYKVEHRGRVDTYRILRIDWSQFMTPDDARRYSEANQHW